jgi:3-(3-hydroxy-phenyl)propionate hydroxylase
MNGSETYDVAIVGGGPVGVAAANFCGVYGLSAVVFDREPGVYDLPRAAGIHEDVQRILHNAGVLEAILPGTSEMAGAEFVTSAGQRITGIEIPPGTRSDNGFPILLNINQPRVEQELRGCLARFDDVSLQVSHEVVSFDERDECVELEVRDLLEQEIRRVRARWLLGCDGARSGVRKSCGIGWNSLGYDCEWLVVDLETTAPVELTPLCQQICDPERPVTVVPMPGRLRRWEFQLKPGETREEMEDRARVWELLEPWLSPDQGEIVRAVVYRFHATIADTFRHGRVFLAGDAAHQTPPFMGQGLCTGVRDVENLVWKLAMVKSGAACDALLDTYTAERHPLAVAMVQHSTNTGRLIDAFAAMERGGPEPAPELQEYAYGGSRTLPDLSNGLLALAGGDWVGRLIPWATVDVDGRGGPLDDVVGPRWSIVSGSDVRSSLSPEALGRVERIGAVFARASAEGPIARLLAEHEAIVVRPDHIIYGVSSADELEVLVERLSASLAGREVPAAPVR